MAVDGSFFKTDANKDGTYTEEKLTNQLEYLDKKIIAYQEALDQQDAIDDKVICCLEALGYLRNRYNNTILLV